MFINLSSQDLDVIASFGRIRKYPKYRTLFHKDDESDGVYIIINGRVKVYICNEYGTELILRYQCSGEYFGELSFIDQEPRSASVTTIEESNISYVSRNNFEKCLQMNPELNQKLLYSLSVRIRDLTEELSDCALKPVYQRLRKKLVQLAEKQGDEYVITQRLTHQEIASMVGCGREMITRLMQKLQDSGHVIKKDLQISIVKNLPKNISSYK